MKKSFAMCLTAQRSFSTSMLRIYFLKADQPVNQKTQKIVDHKVHISKCDYYVLFDCGDDYGDAAVSQGDNEASEAVA
ncbi:uncharacterized protein ANIA_11622 [Aspergillus nidulans FGSC A4]|uniref:Uncharacterized protein n=1 Tax=Emericella nidulans (strain FGSC A4 / ATCC 38163 / CBS 112.46 / NRRL 194 / M139) TaxID=227321 RepID=C8VEU6_EMENI|nr:hypothetical protein [Aspergillus nidulans FGSC A4]CBF80830.1 TPA: hypothetical protein ANIA_11622 [Aspergillus nidulans FGSC A4]